MKPHNTGRKTQCFISDEGTEVLYIIKTGFEDKYITVWEDAYELVLGDTFIGTKEQVETKFSIKLC